MLAQVPIISTQAPIISTDASCGGTAVQEMDAVYQSLPQGLQVQFKSSHDAIITSFNQNVSFLTPYIPFDPYCEIGIQIGAQASTLTSQMQSIANQAGLSVGSPELSWTSLLLIGGLVFAGFFFFEGRRTA